MYPNLVPQAMDKKMCEFAETLWDFLRFMITRLNIVDTIIDKGNAGMTWGWIDVFFTISSMPDDELK